MIITQKQIAHLRAVVHLLGLMPLAALLFAILSGQLGDQPLAAAFPFCGLMAVSFLLLTLWVTPLSKMLGAPLLVKLRRPCGLWSFAWAAGHASLFLARLDFHFEAIPKIAAARPFIIPGQLAFAILLVLALTSSRYAQQALGRNWRRLHRLVYLAAVAAGLHFILAGHSVSPLAGAYAALFAVALGYRVLKR